MVCCVAEHEAVLEDEGKETAHEHAFGSVSRHKPVAGADAPKTTTSNDSVTEPMQQFHSSRNRQNRSLSESGAWCCDMTDPSLSLAHVNGIMNKLHDKSVLEKLGLHIGLDAPCKSLRKNVAVLKL
eukprot:6474196-Amphidinium_carterae.1